MSVAPIAAKWMHSASLYSKTQVRLSLAHTVTIHKNQGRTKGRIKVDIGKWEYFGSLSVVAFSRVKSLKGLRIYPVDLWGLKHNHLQKVNMKN